MYFFCNYRKLKKKKKKINRMRNHLLSAAGEADLFVVLIESAHGNET